MDNTTSDFNKALKYMQHNPAKGEALFRKALRVGEFKEALLNLGTCYRNQDKYAKAMECITRACDPSVPYHDGTFSTHYAMGLNNKGLVHYTYEEDDLARSCYLKALELEPNNYNTVWNLAELSLRRYCSNDPDISLATCWDLYEYRFKRAGGVVLKNKKPSLLTWNGFDSVDSLVVLTEQGHGDMIMFGRYLHLLRPYAKKIYVQCSPALAGLFSDYLVCSDPIETDATHAVPMCSLGKFFPSGIPDGTWLKEKYDTKSPNGKLDIGVAWSGNSDHVNNHNRSCSSGYFLPLNKWGKLYTLNPTESGTKGFSHLASSSFTDTISNLSKLDLVITVDTALAHLCGSVGMPCLVLMPLHTTDFRWGNSAMGTENIWYPSVKVIRNPGNWAAVFKTVGDILENY